MARVGVVLHSGRPEAAELARRLSARLASEGHAVRLPGPDAELLGDELAAIEVVRPDRFGTGLDVALSLGGDGTMLRTVELVARDGVPVIGVNLGQLGYLTEVEPAGVDEALDGFFAGRFVCEERMLLSVLVDRQGLVPPQTVLALNEAVVEKTLSGHTVRLDADIDGAPFTPYAADGVIVATPTGSTAYAFSARGPIVAPTHRALVLTPVSPHMLFDRSLILEPGAHVRLTVEGRSGALIVDGRLLGELRDGDSITCTAADVSARLVMFRPRNFHQILKTKFGLSDR
jgi:NAD+ kinase